jgi:hypothetical protein
MAIEEVSYEPPRVVIFSGDIAISTVFAIGGESQLRSVVMSPRNALELASRVGIQPWQQRPDGDITG